MPQAMNGDVSIFYETSGDGPPIVLIHANPFDRRLWMYQIPTLSSRYRTIALDLRGYGRSSKPETPFTLRDMADDVLAVCRAEGVERAIFMGVSVGSGIAMLIAHDQPEMVAGLVLVGGSSGGSSNAPAIIEAYSAREFLPFYRTHLASVVSPAYSESALGRWILSIFSADADRLSGTCIAQNFRARNACNLKDRLPAIAAPALVINGEHDGALAQGRITASLIPGATHVMIPGAGHACNIEDPVAFDAAIVPFLQTLAMR